MLCVSAFLLGVALVPNLLFSAFYRTVGLVLLCAAILFASRFLLRRYAYAVVPSEDPYAVCADFTVTQYFGTRAATVCRISLCDIVEVIPWSKKKRDSASEKHPVEGFYDYTAQLGSAGAYRLTVVDGERLFEIRILADQALLKLLTNRG